MPETQKASDRIAERVARRVAKREGVQEVGLDLISIIAALLTTLLPTLLDLCKKNAKSLVTSAQNPSFTEEFVLRARGYGELLKARLGLVRSRGIMDDLLADAKENLTEPEAAEYLAEGQ